MVTDSKPAGAKRGAFALVCFCLLAAPFVRGAEKRTIPDLGLELVSIC